MSAHSSAQHGHLAKILSSYEHRTLFSGFIDTVIGTIPSDGLYELVDKIRRESDPETDDQWYQALSSNKASLESFLDSYHLLQTLGRQKKLLAGQMVQLLGTSGTLENVVEIGTPGTYASSLSNYLSITGTIYAVTDKERLSDYVQARSHRIGKKFLGYNSHVPLNNYDPLDPLAVPTNSIDLVICTIGLHHAPPQKLDAFVASIRRVLRPGGVFILRDHDCRDTLLYSMADAAHSLFNIIVSREPLSAENAEIRNFQPLSYWIDFLAKHRFSAGTQRLVQEGDPTANTLVKFSACATAQDVAKHQVMRKVRKDKSQARDQATTYLNAPEWYNVDAAHEYSSFIDHTPWYDFPWIAHVSTFWHIFGQSWRAAAQEVGHYKVITSIDTLTNLFIGVTMSVEYGIKSCLALPVRWLFEGQEPSTVRATLEASVEDVVALDDRINIEKVHDQAGLVEVSLPRYTFFSDILQRSRHSNVVFQEIGGHTKIVFKVRSKEPHPHSFYNDIGGCMKLYDWRVPTHKQYTYAALCVSVESIGAVVDALIDNKIEIIHIHDL